MSVLTLEKPDSGEFVEYDPADAAVLGLDDLLRRYVLRKDANGRSWIEIVVASLVSAAADGDARSQHEIFSRIGETPTTDRPADDPGVEPAVLVRLLEFCRDFNQVDQVD